MRVSMSERNLGEAFAALLGICVLSAAAGGCHQRTVPPAKGDPSAKVVEMRQRSITDDPTVRGELPNGWLVPGARADRPARPTDAGDLQEFVTLFQHTRIGVSLRPKT
jgi:hypothetical protein